MYEAQLTQKSNQASFFCSMWCMFMTNWTQCEICTGKYLYLMDCYWNGWISPSKIHRTTINVTAHFFCIYRNWFCNLDENIATIIAFVYWLTALITLSHPHLDSRIARLHALPSLASLQGHFKDNFLHPVECSSSNSLTINSPNCFKRMSYKSHDSNRKLTQTTPLERQL